jgi:hypothetical protein
LVEEVDVGGEVHLLLLPLLPPVQQQGAAFPQLKKTIKCLHRRICSSMKINLVHLYNKNIAEEHGLILHL